MIGKTVIVTGSSKGIGLEIAKLLINEGYFVVGISRSNSVCFEKLDKENKLFVQFDLSNTKDIPILVAKIARRVPYPIYGLVNNAGIGLQGTLMTQHASDISKILEINLEAPITMSKYVGRQMLRQKEGRIINVSSIIASTGFNGLSVYAASKAGLEGFSRSLSRELGKVNITVNCVAPGYMKTDMTGGISKAKLDSITRRAPLGLPDPLHAAHAVRFLLEPSSSKTTGTIITVDGGSTA